MMYHGDSWRHYTSESQNRSLRLLPYIHVMHPRTQSLKFGWMLLVTFELVEEEKPDGVAKESK